MALEAKGEVPEEQTEIEPKKKSKYTTIDGPRYTVGLQDIKDKGCYKDFFETEKIGEAKEKAAEAMAKHGRETIVFDRIGCPGIIHTETPVRKAEEPVPLEEKDVKKKKKK